MTKFLLSVCLFLLSLTAAHAQGGDAVTQWGYVDPKTPSSKWYSIGVQQTTQLSGAYFIDGKGVLKGARIVAVDVPSLDNNTTGVQVWVKNALSEGNIAAKKYSGKIAKGTFQQVTLDEPVDIPESGLYVGYTATTLYMPTAGTLSIPNSLWLKVPGGGWEDYHENGWGSLLMQIEVTGLQLKDHAAAFEPFVSQRTGSGQTASFVATLKNQGSQPINSIDYTLTVDGVKTARHYDFTKPVKGGLYGQQDVTIELQTPADVKDYEVSLTVDKVNGEANGVETAPVTATFTNLLRSVTRRTVVEEFTGTGCGYCPRGWAGMETMKERYPDSFIGIAVHQYNNNDAMFVGYDYPVSASGAPACFINRASSQLDPYYGTQAHSNGIIGDVQEAGKILPDVDVTVAGHFNADSTQVEATATVERLSNADNKYEVAFALTADSLTGATSAWKQSNYYSSTSASSAGVLDAMPLLKQFCSGGKYGKSTVTLVYNDVQIGGSYKNGNNMAPAISNEAGAGLKSSTSYTISLPNRTVLKKALRYDEMYVVALVINKATGEIVNAARTRVGLDATGIRNTATTRSAAAVEVARYTLDGRKIDTPVKGLNIIKLSDGSVKKVYVRE